MKESELFVGGWFNVSYYETDKERIFERSFNARIFEINKDYITFLLKDGSEFTAFRDDEEDVEDAEIDDVNPIPITKEILKLNNITDYKITDYKNYGGKDGYNFRMCDKVENFTCHIKGIRFVHELQRALILCKLNKCSNNFKIDDV